MIKRHVSAEEIARFGEGDVSRRRAARIGSHLAGCSRCARVRDELAMVPALLARTAAPPMPDHLAARIQTALMTESARRASPAADPDIAAGAGLAAGAASGRGAGSAGRARPERRAAGWSWPRIPGLSGPATRWVATAAAAVLIAGGGSYLIATSTGPSPANNSTASSGSNSSAGPGSAAAAPRTAAGANASVAPVQRGLGPQLSYQRAGQQGKFTPVTTDTNYVPSKLATQVQGTLTAYRQATAASSGTGKVVPHASPDLNSTLRSPGASGASGAQPLRLGPFTAGALESCVTRISAGAQVVLVDVANYQGSPAAVIVIEPANRGPEQVSVVGTGCSASRSDVLTRITLAAGG